MAGSPPTFNSLTSYATGTSPNSVAIGDVNGDGRPDLVSANTGSNTVSVLLGNGDGTFQAQTAYAAGDSPNAVDVGDVNGDGRLDIVAGGIGIAGGTVVLIGNGDGTFQLPTSYASPGGSTSLVLTDLNGDGRSDVVETRTYYGVTVLLGNGDGSLGAPQTMLDRFQGDAGALSLAVGDLNGDGRPDLAVGQNPYIVSILFGNGDGTFQTPQNYTTPSYVNPEVAIGDVNGDGRPDVAAGNELFLGNGDGTFSVATRVVTGPFGPYPTPINFPVNHEVMLDFNGDGRLDIATTPNSYNSTTVSFQPGNGDGTFGPEEIYVAGVGNGPPVTAADLNGDGRPDLVVPNSASNSVSVLINTGPTRVMSVTASQADGVVHLGDTITFTIAMNRAVTITGGTPTLTLNDGGIAVYDAAATAALGDPAKLVFSYTVGASDLPVTGLSFVRGDQNGSQIIDPAGVGPDLSGVFATSFPAIEVATPSTTVTSVVASPSDGVEHVGDTVTFTVTMSRGVTITGDGLTFTLNNGGIATYDAAASAALGDPSKMVLRYTVGASDLPLTGLSFVRGDQNGSVIVDGLGHGPDFSGVFTASFAAIQVDTPPTTVTSVVASPSDGVEHAGDTITFTVTMSRAVTVTGDGLTFTLNDGGIAVYDAAATAALGDPTKMVFSYTVGATDLPMNGLSFVRGDQNGSVIVDGMGRGPDFSGVFSASFAGIQVEATPSVQAAGGEFQIADGIVHRTGSMITAELASGNFAAAWVDSGVLHTQIFDPSGAKLGPESAAPTLTATPPPSTTGPIVWATLPFAIAGLTNGGFVVALDVGANSDFQIEARLFGADGTPISVFQPGSGTYGSNAIALANGDFVVTWSDHQGPKAQFFDSSGTQIESEMMLSDQGRMVRLADGSFVALVSGSSSELSAQRFDAQGDKVGSEFAVNSDRPGIGGSLANGSIAALPTGGFVVSWEVRYDDTSSNDNVIQAQQFDAGGTKVGTQLQVNTDHNARLLDGPNYYDPTVAALADGNFVVTWTDRSGSFGDYVTGVRAQAFDAYRQQWIGTELVVDTITTEGLAFPASEVVGLQDGGFVVTWSDRASEKGQVYATNQPVTTIAADTTLEIPAAFTAKLAFASGGATLQLDNSGAFAGAITGFGDGDRIDLADVAFSGGGTTLGYSANASNSGGHLIVSDGSHIASLTLLGQYAATSFVLSSDGHGGTLITAAQDAANQSQLAAHA